MVSRGTVLAHRRCIPRRRRVGVCHPCVVPRQNCVMLRKASVMPRRLHVGMREPRVPPLAGAPTQTRGHAKAHVPPREESPQMRAGKAREARTIR
jgi:hypothetical protein